MKKEVVHLTSGEVEVARMAGMTPLDFARGKLQLKGARWERAKIVDWLRNLATPENGFLPRTLADWIEDEMHLGGNTHMDDIRF